MRERRGIDLEDWRVSWRDRKSIMNVSGDEFSGVCDMVSIVEDSICSAASFVSNNPKYVG